MLGDLAELGTDAPQAASAARRAGSCTFRIDRLFTVGEPSGHAAQGFSGESRHFSDREALSEMLLHDLSAEDSVLVRGFAFGTHGRSGEPSAPRGGCMLIQLADYLSQFDAGFLVFRYITLRTILAVLTALIISFMVGPAMIRRLSRYKISQTVRNDGPQTHLSKSGTPTMGGALILVAVAVATCCGQIWATVMYGSFW